MKMEAIVQIDSNGRGPEDLGRNGKSPASASARLKDIVDSYLRQLYGANTSTRVLAAQGLGALPSFLPPSKGPEALRLAMDLCVVESLIDVLAVDDELPVQEACLMALAALLLSTASYEDHAAPFRPPHLKMLGAALLRPQVVDQIGYVLTATTSSRVVLAAARVMAITAPYITQANDVYILDSRIVPALLAAAAARPHPGGRGTDEGDGDATPVPATPVAVPTPRDAAACVLALMALAQSTPDLYVAICTADFLQCVSVLYERCIDPDLPSDVMLPADGAELLLRCATLAPNPLWPVTRLPPGLTRSLERNVEESDVLGCLVSYVAVESGNLRRLGEDLAAAAAGNAEAVVQRNRLELEQLQADLHEQRQQLAEARVAVQTAVRKLEAAEAAEADTHDAVEAAVTAAAERGGGAALRQARREAAAAATAGAEAVVEQRRAVDAAEAVVAQLQESVASLRREMAPLRWQSDRMTRLKASIQTWRDQYGFKNRSKVKVSRPNLPMLTKVLAFLAAKGDPARSGSSSSSGSGSPKPCTSAPSLPSPAASPSSPSTAHLRREHVAAVLARLLESGLVQAVVQLNTVLGGVESLTQELAAVAGDLALHSDLAAALEGAVTQLRREAEGLGSINRRAELRLRKVYAEAAKLRKALLLELPLPEGSPQAAAMELGPGNGLSRTVRQEDVEQRLEALGEEADDLEAALGDSEALVGFLHDKIGAIDAATSALSESHATFLKAFPAQAAPATPAIAPNINKRRNSHDDNGQMPLAPGDNSGQPEAATAAAAAATHTLRPASRSILAKDPSHPAGHLLGQLSRALAPVTRGSVLNLPAMVRQLLGRPPDGGGGTTANIWPPSPAANTSPADLASAAAAGGAAFRSRSRSRSVGSAMLAASRPSSAGAAAAAGGRAVRVAAAARPSSARSAGSVPNVERSTLSGGASSILVGGLGRIGSGTATGYGNGLGSFGDRGGLLSSGPFPTDATRRPMRYSRESMYGTIQSTFSPEGSYSGPRNSAGLVLQLREKNLARSSGGAGGAGVRNSHSGAAPLRASVTLTADRYYYTADVMPPVSLPLADESRRVVHQVVSSILFDPVNADVMGPGVVQLSAAGAPLTLPERPSGRPLTAYGSKAAAASNGGMPEATGAVAAPPPRPTAAGGGDLSVLDALLMQSELLCSVMQSLATLQQFSRSTIRTCRHLPATVSYASLQPGSLGPYMARLHGMWAGAIARHPEIRVQVAEAVTEIAQLALVPGSDFESVYRDTGLVEVLVQMLASGLRPAKAAAVAAGIGEAIVGGPMGVGAGGTGGRKSRYVGRLSATAPPTLRMGPVQQAEQAAAGTALRAISHAQNDVLGAIGQDSQLLTRLSTVVLDHSMSWPARQAAADLLSDLVLGGGPGAEAAIASGAYAGLVEMLNRDMYPFVNQDPRGCKETVISALACLVAHPELLEGVVAAAMATHGPSSGLPLSSPHQVVSAILRTLWGVVWQVYTIYISDRTGRGRYVNPELISALTSTAATSARELAVLADTVDEARRMMIGDLGLKTKITGTFLQVIKDPTLNESLLELRKNLS